LFHRGESDTFASTFRVGKRSVYSPFRRQGNLVCAVNFQWSVEMSLAADVTDSLPGIVARGVGADR